MPDQETMHLILVVIYLSSSVIGATLFTLIWRATHLDRVELPGKKDDARYAVATRNEIVAAILTLTFWLYVGVGATAVIRTLEYVALPWEAGLLTTLLLVVGNFIEMNLAIVLLWARRSMNR